MEHFNPTWIEIDIKQLKSNFFLIKKILGETKFCLPVKANAYGHGLCQVAKIAEECGVDYLGVSSSQEGVALRESGIQIPILVLGAIHQEQIKELVAFNLEFTLSSLFKAQIVKKYLSSLKNAHCSVHLEVDTGMQRTGVKPETFLELYDFVRKEPCFNIAGIYSHLAKSNAPDDNFNKIQIDLFNQVQKIVGPSSTILFHLNNSGGVTHFPHSFKSMARPGLLSFGMIEGLIAPPWSELKPAFTLKSKISYFKVVPKGTGISYGHRYVTTRQTRVVTVPIGYGDGYRYAMSNKSLVLIGGKKHPTIGSICMDQLMVDIGDDSAYVGDEVVLLGTQGNETISVFDLAEWCSTIAYEIVCGFNQRVPRIYV